MSNKQSAPSTPQPSAITPLTVEEEDAIIHSRITNDERALRRVIKKFHGYTSVAHEPIVPIPSSSIGIEDARDAFLVELASFSLQLKKAVMVCEAEARQVEEYHRERQRIEDERVALRGQIEQLKTSLEHAQLERRRKIEYDLVAEKINTLPSRQELQRTIDSLENDMAAIRVDHDAQNRLIHAQKSALVSIISELGSLRLMGKDTETPRGTTPAVDAVGSDGEVAPLSIIIAADVDTEKEEGEEDRQSSDDVPLSATLNPGPRAFHASRDSVATGSRSLRSRTGLSSAPQSAAVSRAASKSIEDDDIEMGELTEEPKDLRTKAKVREELEEGEASDESSELSDPPDD